MERTFSWTDNLPTLQGQWRLPLSANTDVIQMALGPLCLACPKISVSLRYQITPPLSPSFLLQQPLPAPALAQLLIFEISFSYGLHLSPVTDWKGWQTQRRPLVLTTANTMDSRARYQVCPPPALIRTLSFTWNSLPEASYCH